MGAGRGTDLINALIYLFRFNIERIELYSQGSSTPKHHRMYFSEC